MSYVMVDSSALASFLTTVKGYISVTTGIVIPLFAIVTGIVVAVFVVKMFLK